MKIEVDCVDDIFDQITTMVPPTQKDDYKFLSILRKLIERNVVVNPSRDLQELIEKSEQKDQAVSTLALFRGESPVRTKEKFSEHVEKVKQKINDVEKSIAEADRFTRRTASVETYSKMVEEIARIESVIPRMREKLRRAYEVVGEAFNKSPAKNLEPYEYVENVFRSI